MPAVRLKLVLTFICAYLHRSGKQTKPNQTLRGGAQGRPAEEEEEGNPLPEQNQLSDRRKKGSEKRMTSAAFQLPPGFRFHPTDEELVNHYLCRKCASQSISVPIVKEIDLCKFDPWELPELALYGDKEWYFFSPRDRKYPNGSRPNRAAGAGYWKATGADKPIGRPKTLGIKKALVFYAGKAPVGVKTNWIMHEYRLANVDRSAGAGKKNNLRLDDWVLCRIYNKKGIIEKHYPTEKKLALFPEMEDQKPNITMPAPNIIPQQHPHTISTHQMWMDTTDSTPRLHTDSIASEHATLPEVKWEKEGQSEAPWTEFEKELNSDFNYSDGFSTDMFRSSDFPVQMDQLSRFQDMYMYMQKSP